MTASRFTRVAAKGIISFFWIMAQQVGCSLWGRWESDRTERLPFHFSLSCIGEGNGNPLQCSCLENPRDGGAWWAAVYGVAQSRTRLKRRRSSSSSRIPLCVGHLFSIRAPVDGHLGCFHVLAVVSSAAVNTGVHVAFWIIVLSRYIPEVGLQNHMAALVFIFWGTSILFCIVAAPVSIPTSTVGGFPCLHTLSSICYLWTS